MADRGEEVALGACGRLRVVAGASQAARGEFLRKWGREGSANGSFRDPRDVVVDLLGRVLVADTGNGRVQVFTKGGAYLTKWDAATIAPDGFNPLGLATDRANRIYVADTANDRIEVYAPSS